MPGTFMAFVATVSMAACGKTARPSPPGGSPGGLSRALSEHGVRLGQVAPAVRMECSDGVSRNVGAKDTYQLITFATKSDCAMCNLHLASLDRVEWNDLPPVDRFIVSWSPIASDVRHIASAGQDTALGLPLCLDREGVLWDSLSLSHTPFTTILANGVVVYLEDRDLSRVGRLEEFVGDLSSLLAVPKVQDAKAPADH